MFECAKIYDIIRLGKCKRGTFICFLYSSQQSALNMCRFANVNTRVHCSDKKNGLIQPPTSTGVYQVCHIVLDYQQLQLFLLIEIEVMSSEQSF